MSAVRSLQSCLQFVDPAGSQAPKWRRFLIRGKKARNIFHWNFHRMVYCQCRVGGVIYIWFSIFWLEKRKQHYFLTKSYISEVGTSVKHLHPQNAALWCPNNNNLEIKSQIYFCYPFSSKIWKHCTGSFSVSNHMCPWNPDIYQGGKKAIFWPALSAKKRRLEAPKWFVYLPLPFLKPAGDIGKGFRLR